MKKKPPTTGQLIRVVRLDVGLSQQELSERSGVAQNGISKIENDLRPPDVETVQRIAAVLGCPWKDLLAD